MYSEKKTRQNLKKFEKEKGVTLVAHSESEVDEFKEYVNSITHMESNSRRAYVTLSENLSKERQEYIRKWVENEQMMCAIDASYFESRYAYIRSETGGMKKFKNRPSQEIIDRIFAEHEEKGIATELIIGKTRQQGLTAKILLKFMHRALFYPNTSIVIGTVSNDIGFLSSSTWDTIYNSLPWWIVPTKLPKGRFENRSEISIRSQRQGFAQGLTPKCVLIEEAHMMQRPMQTIEEGLLRAVHPSRDTCLVIDGEINDKKSDWFTETWKSSNEYWPQGKARLRPVHIPWAMCADMYPSFDWIKKFPIPRRWVPMKETVAHANLMFLYVHSQSYLTDFVGKKWTMPKEQMWFWEHGLKRARATHTEGAYLAQMRPDGNVAGNTTPPQVEVEDDIDLDYVFPSSAATQKRILDSERA